jgi:hypothetical protein
VFQGHVFSEIEGKLGRTDRIIVCICYAAVLSLLSVAVVSIVTIQHRPQESARAPISNPNQSAEAIGRYFLDSRSGKRADTHPLYPYSIIPGGIESAQELQKAILNDALVAGHYADFNVARAHLIRLNEDRLVYVSYRLNDRVYWTSKKLKLSKGETLMTDGEHEARTRCGNRLSDIQMQPISPREPDVGAMEVLPGPDLVAGNAMQLDLPAAVLPAPISTFSPILPAGSTPGGPPSGGLIPPPFFPIVGGGPTTTTPETPLPPTPPIVTSEPDTLKLLSVGIAILLAGGLSAAIRRRAKA